MNYANMVLDIFN